ERIDGHPRIVERIVRGHEAFIGPEPVDVLPWNPRPIFFRREQPVERFRRLATGDTDGLPASRLAEARHEALRRGSRERGSIVYDFNTSLHREAASRPAHRARAAHRPRPGR